MSDLPDDMAERHGRMLKRLGEMSMALAEETFEAARNAKDPQERERLAAAFHRLSRSLRQTLALEARLERERHRQRIEAERHADELRQVRVKGRRDQVNASLTRLIWTEAERCDYDDLLRDLDKILNDEALREDFLDGPVEDLIERISADLGFVNEEDEEDEDVPDPSPLAGEGGLPEEGRMRGLSDASASAQPLNPQSG